LEPGAVLAREIAGRKPELIDLIEAEVYKAAPGVWERFGEAGKANIRQDIGYNLDFLAESIKYNDIGIFTRYVHWLGELFRGLHLPTGTLEQTLSTMRTGLSVAFEGSLPEAVRLRLDAAMSIAPLALDSAGDQAGGGSQPRKESGPAIVQPANLQAISPGLPVVAGLEKTTAEVYLGHLLAGDRSAAAAIVMDMLDAKADVRSIYLDVFQESQYTLGKMWLSGAISVAQEHFCTAATQSIMSRMYPHIFSSPKTGKRLVATSASGELHEIGIRILADLFELEGWDSYYLGANTPANAIVSALRDQKAQLLCISATMIYNLKAVEAIIAAVRAAFPAGEVKILVGGYAFKSTEGLWKTVGADGFAQDASGAIRLADSLVDVAGDRA